MPLLWLALCACSTSAPQHAAAPLPVPAARKVVRVDVWHDLVCPWCRIGLHNLDAAVAGLKDVQVEVVHHAYQLEPNAPQSGTDMRRHLQEKFGADKVDAMLSRVAAAGAESGVEFHWDAVKVSPNTAAAHALLAWAPLEKRPAVAAGLHRAHFDEGKNLGDPEVLAQVAGAAGLDVAAARAAVQDPARLAGVSASVQDAARRGITGVPYFDVGGRVLRGSQSAATLAATLQGMAK
jgi:predicted DsbA family dithiol-disulfide isomerase